jgi:hypothetical protein
MHDLFTYFFKLKKKIRRRRHYEHLPLSSDPSNAVLGHQIRFYFWKNNDAHHKWNNIATREGQLIKQH